MTSSSASTLVNPSSNNNSVNNKGTPSVKSKRHKPTLGLHYNIYSTQSLEHAAYTVNSCIYAGYCIHSAGMMLRNSICWQPLEWDQWAQLLSQHTLELYENVYYNLLDLHDAVLTRAAMHYGALNDVHHMVK